MNCKFIVVSSITYAMKGKSKLEEFGIFSKIEKIKKVAKLNGCGYGLKVNDADVTMASRILSADGIKVIDTVECGMK